MHAITVGDDNVHIDGLQIHRIFNGFSGSASFYVTLQDPGSQTSISNCIMSSDAEATGYGIFVADEDTNIKIYNNIIYNSNDESGGDGMWLENDINAQIFNNTVYQSHRGIYVSSGAASNITLKNNISFDNDDWDFDNDTYNSSSTNNASTDTSASNTTLQNGIVSQTASDHFRSTTAGSEDFRLKTTSSLAGKGVNLYSDIDLPIEIDIEGEARPEAPKAFDIGADQISESSDHDNYSMSLYNDSARVTTSEEIFATYEEDIPENRWTNIAFARDSVDQYLYINGTQREHPQLKISCSNNGKLYIGAQDDNSQFLSRIFG